MEDQVLRFVFMCICLHSFGGIILFSGYQYEEVLCLLLLKLIRLRVKLKFSFVNLQIIPFWM